MTTDFFCWLIEASGPSGPAVYYWGEPEPELTFGSLDHTTIEAWRALRFANKHTADIFARVLQRVYPAPDDLTWVAREHGFHSR